jgi:hypothetical protein
MALPAIASERPLDLTGAVDLIARSFPGRIVAAQVDANGGEALHYHVDMLLPGSRLARFDVDGVTGRIFNRLPPEELPAGTASLQAAVKKVESTTQGRAVAAEFDPDPSPHYHVNVRLPGGKLARYDVSTATEAVIPHASR